MAKNQTAKKPIRVRKDGRRQLLVYLEPELIKTLKKAAVDHDVNVYDIVDEATREWLGRHTKKSKG
jgi:hypothetical protein